MDEGCKAATIQGLSRTTSQSSVSCEKFQTARQTETPVLELESVSRKKNPAWQKREWFVCVFSLITLTVTALCEILLSLVVFSSRGSGLTTNNFSRILLGHYVFSEPERLMYNETFYFLRKRKTESTQRK